ncbi:hypothetical protein CK203_115489 [Vitis vinifera]|uniref:Uncharacterized protein n=1 Tax=Vitis vinifera TaxID=29760 RepID=A0A438D7T6_VITVI|nr:hypothetical protein CK203_115489 [Vitis vinifera]
MEFGAREVALEAPEIFLAAPEMAPATELAWESARELELEPGDGIGEGSGDCSVKSMGSELSTLGLFCDGRPPDRVRLFLRFEGDEDLAPRVHAISGYRNLADVADRRR